ncbi:hypothetical protein [Anatilimnocola floriformis]|uniref:hypothetical protein n=1 Tax=Anatilimnocola floriformis TaxID=2948575 RepID=UPI0020C2E470|nr:hypothetical protein [Anatilimnocola floriformis]
MTELFSNPATVTLTLTATLLAGVILLRYYRRAVETMLFIPWAWAVGTFAVVAAANIFGEFAEQNRFGLFLGNYGALHFVAASGTLCPFVALIGAKRPQHSAWSFVVLALWGMIALPAAEVLLLNPGQDLEFNSIRSWFLLALILGGMCNFLLTRYFLGSFLLGMGQLFWLGRWLPWSFQPYLASREWAGLFCVSTAVIAAWWVSRSPTRAPNDYDRLWFDFRDTFGLFWSLRLIERVNDAARQAGWDFDLGWGGFRTKSSFEPLGKLEPETAEALRNCLQGSLRRFVSNEWMAERLPSQQ